MKRGLKEIAGRLTAIRRFTGLSQRDFANHLKISPKSWQAYELGETMPGGAVFEALRNEGFSVDWVLTGKGAMQPVRAALTKVKRASEAAVQFALVRSGVSLEQQVKMRDAAFERGLDLEGLEALYGADFPANGAELDTSLLHDVIVQVFEHFDPAKTETRNLAKMVVAVYQYMQAHKSKDSGVMRSFLEVLAR